MQVLYPRCCALDVHKETVVACLRLVIDDKVVKETRTFETTTASLMMLSDWLAENKCTHIAMEATGVYWKPVWHILAGGDFELILANAAHVKNVPGRKTDVSDADWLTDLLAHGLIRPSFVPDAPTQDLRALLRTRKQLVREQSSHVLRVQKTLEDANIKLDSVISDIMGKSGRAMIKALIAGERDPAKLARLADGRAESLPGKVVRGSAWPRYHEPPLSAPPTSPPDRSTGRRHRCHRSASGGRHRALSHRGHTVDHCPWCKSPGCTSRPLRDRTRYEPLSLAQASDFLGVHLSKERRERRQASL
jgi:hypothetical protein